MINSCSYAVKQNLILESVSDAVSELKRFQQAGGGTVCDVTITGLRNKPEALPQISRESGVNIVTGTGYYLDYFLPEEAKLFSVHEVNCMVQCHYLECSSLVYKTSMVVSQTPTVSNDVTDNIIIECH